MHSEFKIVDLGGLRFVQYTPWTRRGIKHGFSCAGVKLKREEREANLSYIAQVLQINRICLTNQVHSNSVVMADNSNCDADGIVARSSSLLGVAVLTADCVPILIYGKHSVAAIHAGWRGVAGGIIINAIEKVCEFDQVQDLEIVIGPCAGVSCYEVGKEVISAINGSVHEVRDSKIYLDLSATIYSQIITQVPKVKLLENVGICTICDSRFNSYRRDGERAGRNLNFIST